MNKRTHKIKFTNIDIRSGILHLGRRVDSDNDRSFFAILTNSSDVVLALQADILVGGDVDDACCINALFVFLDAVLFRKILVSEFLFLLFLLIIVVSCFY